MLGFHPWQAAMKRPMRAVSLVVAAVLLAPAAHASSLVAGDIVVVDQGNAVFGVAPITGDRTVISSNSVGSGTAE